MKNVLKIALLVLASGCVSANPKDRSHKRQVIMREHLVICEAKGGDIDACKRSEIAQCIQWATDFSSAEVSDCYRLAGVAEPERAAGKQ